MMVYVNVHMAQNGRLVQILHKDDTGKVQDARFIASCQVSYLYIGTYSTLKEKLFHKL